MYDFNGQNVVITGGSRGIGFATAKAFLERGAHVAICSKDPDRIADAESGLRPYGSVTAQVADVRDRGQVESFVNRVVKELTRIDVLVNNAGATWIGDFAQEDYESIDRVIDVNVKGVMYMTRAVLPHMLEQNNGTVVSISSGAGLSGFPGIVAYCTSKFGVVGFTESLDQEVHEHGVRVYGVCPGPVATDMQKQHSGAKVGMPPERVASRILQLASDSPGAATGTGVSVE
jgi:3-oxoacyl-[acyl-carrier protein] reductase